MSKQSEFDCLEKIKQKVFTDNYLSVSDEEFEKYYLLYIHLDHKRLFGFTEEDEREFVKILREVTPNDNPTSFPDFVFENGFIEHFQITSSKETRKGATETKDKASFDRQVAEETKIFMDECNANPSREGEVRKKTWEREGASHSYEQLVYSMQKNVENHLYSLAKYTGNKGIGIFLIENKEMNISMVENIFEGFPEGVSHGDLREQRHFPSYRISKDKEMLNFLYSLKDKIKYIIYAYKDEEKKERKSIFEPIHLIDDFEIIKIETIPHLLKLLPWDFMIHAKGYMKEVVGIYNTTIKEKDNNE